MKVIISPAKSLNFEDKAPVTSYSQPNFLEQSQVLNTTLRGLSAKELSALMKISDNLGQLNDERNHSWTLPFTLDNAKQAVYAFTGDVYKGLDAQSIALEKVESLQNTLRIISGLYGLLKPLDLIQPYRLEMGTKLVTQKGTNLYTFWGEDLVNALNQEMTANEVLVNLASNEYAKAIPQKKLQATMITPVFKELKGDVYKVVAIYAKKARGLMARYIIDNGVTTIDELKSFHAEGYQFDENLSSNSELVFTR